MDAKKKRAFFLMFILVTLWGLDYSVAKNALDFFEPMCLMFFKYFGGVVVLFILKLMRDRKFTIKKKDIIFFVSCSVTGQILYYFCEYTAMAYIPVSLITIILSFVPIVSIIIERIACRHRFFMKIIAGLLVCVVGITCVIGADFGALFQGGALGYLLAFGAVISWNAYNFITAKITESYDSLTMSFNQLLCTVLLSAPYAFTIMPPLHTFSPEIIISIIYLGVGSAGLGYLIMINGIANLGPTVTSVFTNFIPVTSTFFGWLILGQTIVPLQIIGGIIVVTASCVVIIEKGRLDRLRYIERL